MRHLTLSLALILGIATALLGACGEPATDDSTSTQALGSGAADRSERRDACDAARQAAQSSKPHKVTICHIPPGNPANAHMINVSKNAIRAHLAHGDVLGGCGCDDDNDDNDHNDDPGDGDQPDDVVVPGDGGDSPPSNPPLEQEPDDGTDPPPNYTPPGDGALCDADQISCSQDAQCGDNRACDATSGCCVDVFL